MNVVIFQPADGPMAVLCAAQGFDLVAEAQRVVPAGIQFWVVPKTDIDELYAEQGHVRDAWELSEEAIGRKPDGLGGAK